MTVEPHLSWRQVGAGFCIAGRIRRSHARVDIDGPSPKGQFALARIQLAPTSSSFVQAAV